MPKTKETDAPQKWTCPYCQQTAPVDEKGQLQGDDDFGERCLLPEHIVNGECVAYRNRRRALDLLLDPD